MGLLDQYDKAKKYAAGLLAQVPQNAQDMYQGLLSAPSQVSDLFSQQKAQQLAKALKNPQQANPQQWMDAGMNLAGMAPVMGLLGHTVYHGSPHKFTKFDMGKIGTGEGAQAYGHGLYFAENPGVARNYSHMVSNNPGVSNFAVRQDAFLNGEKLTDAELGAALYAWNSGKSTDNAIRKLQLRKEDFYGQQYFKKNPDQLDLLNKQIDFLKKLDISKLKVQDNGNLYKVDIPDEVIPRMLDWDKPLSEQPEVWKVLQEKFPYLGNQGHKTGEWALGEIGEGIGGLGPKLTQEMQQAGIHGIRYLDRNSRGAGGTSNFVLFDDQLPRILEVNGQPTGLKPWKAK